MKLEIQLEIECNEVRTCIDPIQSISFKDEDGTVRTIDDCTEFQDYFDCVLEEYRGLYTVVFNTPVDLDIDNGLHIYEHKGVTKLIESAIR
jgi:hypothetical protein